MMVLFFNDVYSIIFQMIYSLNKHSHEYGVTWVEALKSPFVSPYAARHFKLANRKINPHYVLGCLESVPVFGLLISLIERIVVLVCKFFQRETKLTVKAKPVSKTIKANSFFKIAQLDNDSLSVVSKFLTISDAASLSSVNKDISRKSIWNGQAAALKIPISKNHEVSAQVKKQYLATKDLAAKALFEFFKRVYVCHDKINEIQKKTYLTIFQQAQELRNWIKQNKAVEKVTLLDIIGVKIRSIPPEICYLKNLEELQLKNNELSQLPKEIGSLIKLKSLIVQKNQLTQLPVEIGSLKELERLFLNENKLEQLPIEIGNLQHLEEFLLHNNAIVNLPIEIKYLRKLSCFGCFDNPLDAASKKLNLDIYRKINSRLSSR